MNFRATVVALVLLVAACSTPSGSGGPVNGLTPTAEVVTLPVTTVATECSASAKLAAVSKETDALAMLQLAAELAAAQDLACGVPESLERQCRAVFFIGSTEPTLVWAGGGDWQASLDVWSFATNDGVASSPADLVLMWGQLARFTDGVGVALASNDEVMIARLVTERADAVAELAALEGLCALG